MIKVRKMYRKVHGFVVFVTKITHLALTFAYAASGVSARFG